jgi:hypothetical protein
MTPQKTNNNIIENLVHMKEELNNDIEKSQKKKKRIKQKF